MSGLRCSHELVLTEDTGLVMMEHHFSHMFDMHKRRLKATCLYCSGRYERSRMSMDKSDLEAWCTVNVGDVVPRKVFLL
jgi:hypothetical protein